MLTLQLSFKNKGDEYWTVLEKDCEVQDLEALAAEAAAVVLHCKEKVLRTEK